MPNTLVNIRAALPADVSEVHALLRDSLTFDRFSEDLLAEKLFPAAWSVGMKSETLVAESGGSLVGVMQHAVHATDRKAWIGLFAVDESHRGNGIARHLFEHIRTRWPNDIGDVEVLAIPGNYFTPGLDPRYTRALSFVESLGFERFKDCVNLQAPLERAFETNAEAQRLQAKGVEVRRAGDGDRAALDAFFAGDFGAGWRYEAELALANKPPALHLALRDDRIIGFSAHSTQNREWGFFGPMGTTPEARGLGVGRVLLWHCLNDLRAGGHKTSLIPWVGPISFYSKWCKAVVDRVFWRYRLLADIRG